VVNVVVDLNLNLDITACTPDELGRVVREAWVAWAQTQPYAKPSWLASYDDLNEADKEADRQIGLAVVRHVLDHLVVTDAR
jgi:hypothetical protein